MPPKAATTLKLALGDDLFGPAQDEASTTFPDGFIHAPGLLDRVAQEALRDAIASIVKQAPWFTPRMPRSGAPFSVAMTNCGPLGWVSDKDGGYRYQSCRPETGAPWPAIPQQLIDLWTRFAGADGLPEACLVNFYAGKAKMGSHRDADEHEPRAPVLSVSLGDDAVFHVGGPKRSDPKMRVTLRSGDVAVLSGPSRFAYHGIDKIVAGSSDLLAGGGRINLTLRRVTPYAAK